MNTKSRFLMNMEKYEGYLIWLAKQKYSSFSEFSHEELKYLRECENYLACALSRAVVERNEIAPQNWRWNDGQKVRKPAFNSYSIIYIALAFILLFVFAGISFAVVSGFMHHTQGKYVYGVNILPFSVSAIVALVITGKLMVESIIAYRKRCKLEIKETGSRYECLELISQLTDIKIEDLRLPFLFVMSRLHYFAATRSSSFLEYVEGRWEVLPNKELSPKEKYVQEKQLKAEMAEKARLDAIQANLVAEQRKKEAVERAAAVSAEKIKQQEHYQSWKIQTMAAAITAGASVAQAKEYIEMDNDIRPSVNEFVRFGFDVDYFMPDTSPAFNIDGTPMIDGMNVDVHGNPFGVTQETYQQFDNGVGDSYGGNNF